MVKGSASAGCQDRTLAVVAGKQSLQTLDLRQIVIGDIGTVWIAHQIVLVVPLGSVEAFQRVHTRDNRVLENASFAQLGNVCRGDVLLRVAVVDDGRPVLGASVGALSVQLRRIVYH